MVNLDSDLAVVGWVTSQWSTTMMSILAESQATTVQSQTQEDASCHLGDQALPEIAMNPGFPAARRRRGLSFGGS